MSLCVEGNQANFELSWALCCEAESCCPDDAPLGDASQIQEAQDECRDYLLSSTQDWTPDPRSDWNVALAALTSPPAWSFSPAVWWPEQTPPSGAPPPRRDLRTVVIRC